MPVDPKRMLFTDTDPATRGFRHELVRALSDAVTGPPSRGKPNPSHSPHLRGVRCLKIVGVVLLAVVALVVGRRSYRQYQHRRQVRTEFAAQHAQDCAESWNGVETALHPYEEAHKHLLDQLTTEDTEAVVNRDVPTYLTRAAALHDSLIHARAICPAQADPSRATNTDRVGAIEGVDVRDLY